MKTLAVVLLMLCGAYVLVGRHLPRPDFSFSLRRSSAQDVVEKSFDVSPGGLLTVDANEGSIEVQTSESNSVAVRVIRRVETRGEAEAQRLLKQMEISFSQTGSNLRISSRSPNNGRKRLEFQIVVPRVYNVDLKTSGGSVSVDGIHGEVRSKSSGGGLKFSRIDGSLRGETSGGGITASDVSGQLVAETSGGGINLSNIGADAVVQTSGGSITAEKIRGSLTARTSGGSLKIGEIAGVIDAKTSGGNVTARFPQQPAGDSRFETSGGNITIYLAEAVSVNLDAEARSGHVVTDFPISVTVQGKLDGSSLRGGINGGGPLLSCRTTGSNIQLRKLTAER
jgi:putative adhesin